MSRYTNLLAAHPQRSLALMLLALHASVAWGIEEWWPRAFLLAHLGLFLLWQPIWRGEREIKARQAVAVVAVACLLVGWHSWWLMALWLALLVGLIGGSVPRIGERRQRIISILAALYILSLLLMWVVPQLFAEQFIDPGLTAFVRYALPLIPAVLLVMRAPPRVPLHPAGVDLFYTLLFFLLVVALVLGSFVVRDASHGNYVIALAQTLFGIAVMLIALSWLWYPHSGFAGLGFLLSTYLISLGLPFERWVQRLAELAEQENDPSRFLQEAMQHMLDMPWVKGVEWQLAQTEGQCGSREMHATQIKHNELTLVIYTRWAVSPAILLHLKLLAQMVAHFYEAKQREQVQRQSAYTTAIHETGARLTHDVKNLLQSLKALCAAAEASSPQEAAALQALMQRQLPQITHRLNSTLDKLKSPQLSGKRELSSAQWWSNLVQRYGARKIEFIHVGPMCDSPIPVELFDSVGDNLIENAAGKAVLGGDVRIKVVFSPEAGGWLQVRDTGAPVPASVTAHLFHAPVASHSGFGVGLYHSSRLAIDNGYRLTLAVNEPGSVIFELARDEHTDVSQQRVA